MNYLRISTMCLFLTLAACGGSGDDNPTAPEPGATPGASETPDSDPVAPGEDGAAPDRPADAGELDDELLTEVASDLPAPRDLIFGRPGSSLNDELFVVNFVGAEAIWVRNFEEASQSLTRIQDSLVGAIAVDVDGEGRFFFACLTPVMGSNIGVITVRLFDSSVIDAQYPGVAGPLGVALDSVGRLFVANRDSRSVTRIDFADGNGADRHDFEIIAEDLSFSSEELPAHLLVDPNDRLFICETDMNRIQVWSDDDGQEVFATAAQGLSRPVGIARRSNGNILVTNNGDSSIVELDPEGAAVRRIDTGFGNGVLHGIAVRADGQVYVVTDIDGIGSVFRVDL
jgi:sugar lactone lactonase YvrE